MTISAARVAWISPLTARLLIVNRRGMKRMIVSPEELAILVATGAVIYVGWLLVFSRTAVRELVAVVRKQPIPT